MLDVAFTRLTAEDVLAIQAQPRQRTVFGMDVETTYDDALAMAQAPIAWAARVDGRLIACFGIVDHFTGLQGLGWTILAEGIGQAHLPLTRFIRAAIDGCGLARLELIARGPDIEPILASRPDLDSGQIVAIASSRPTPEMRWALMLGMQPAHLLRCYGAASETYMLFERLRPRAASSMSEAA